MKLINLKSKQYGSEFFTEQAYMQVVDQMTRGDLLSHVVRPLIVPEGNVPCHWDVDQDGNLFEVESDWSYLP